jgi:hypothetical protein
MPKFDFRVTVEAATREDADRAMDDMLNAEIEIETEYTVWDWEITGDPDGYGE